jgi:hypothetical protein
MNFATQLTPGDEGVHLTDRELEKIYSGVNDAAPEPSVMSFFAGREYKDGLKAYNAHLAKRGQAPIR